MEEDKKLYPMRFCTLEDSYSWGKECFKLADLGYRDSLVHDGWLAGNSISEIMDMYMDRIVGDDVFERFGRQFPLQVKMIQVEGKLPLQVHPDDETAAQRYDFLGKDKLWYIVSAEPGSKLYLGFNGEIDASRFWEAVSEGPVEEILHTEEAVSGQAWHIPSGLVHGACGKMLIAEISESSPLDFCVHSWGEEVSDEQFDPALTLTDALDFIDYSSFKGGPLHLSSDGTLVNSPQFTSRLFKLGTPLHIYSETATGFEILLCLSGEASVQAKDEDGKSGKEFILSQGEVILVPSECPDFLLSPRKEGTLVLEATVNALPEKDPYINPDADPTLPEDR